MEWNPTLIHRLPGEVSALSCSGGRLVIGYADGHAEVWSGFGRDAGPVTSISFGREAIRRIELDPETGTVFVLQAELSRVAANGERRWLAFESKVRSFALSSDRIAAVGTQGVVVWNRRDLERTLAFRGRNARSISFVGTNALAVLNVHGKLSVHDADTGVVRHRVNLDVQLTSVRGLRRGGFLTLGVSGYLYVHDQQGRVLDAVDVRVGRERPWPGMLDLAGGLEAVVSESEDVVLISTSDDRAGSSASSWRGSSGTAVASLGSATRLSHCYRRRSVLSRSWGISSRHGGDDA